MALQVVIGCKEVLCKHPAQRLAVAVGGGPFTPILTRYLEAAEKKVNERLVGGWTNPLKKYMRKSNWIVFPQLGIGVNMFIPKYLKPAT